MQGTMPPPEALQPRSVDAGRGVSWWVDAWALFVKNVPLWIVLALILFVTLVLLTLVPFIGSIVAALITPPLMGGWLLASRNVEGGGALEVGDLFTCFKAPHFTPLLVVGAIFLAMMVLTFLIVGMLGLGAFTGVAMGGANRSMGSLMAGMGMGLLSLLLMLVLLTLATMALWFAPALVVFRGVAPLDAMRVSFSAGLKNMMPFLLYGLLYIVAAIVASIPFGLGWLALLPVTMLTTYVSYKDVFGS
jgi:uncharacterized membrane protein